MLFQHNISFLYDLLSTPFAPFVLQRFEIFCSNIISFLPKIYFTVVSYNTNPLVLKYFTITSPPCHVDKVPLAMISFLNIIPL